MLLSVFLESSLLLLLALGVSAISLAPALRSKVLFGSILLLPALLTSTVLDWSLWSVETTLATPIELGQLAAPELVNPTSVQLASAFLPQLYLLSAIVLLLRQLFELIGSWRLLRHSVACDDPRVVEQVAQLCRQFGISKPPRLVICWQVDNPGVVGWLRPKLLLPPSIDTTSSERLSHLLAHELAHIQRRDWIKLQLARLVCAVCWLQPLVWLVLRRARTEMELACDYAAIQLNHDPADYAETLAQCAASRCMPASLTFASRPKELLGRVQRILAYRPQSVFRAWSAFSMLAIAAVALISLSVAQVTVPLVPIASTLSKVVGSDVAEQLSLNSQPTPAEISESVPIEAADGAPPVVARTAPPSGLVQAVLGSNESNETAQVAAVRDPNPGLLNPRQLNPGQLSLNQQRLDTYSGPPLSRAELLSAIVEAGAADGEPEVFTDERWRRDDTYQAEFSLALGSATPAKSLPSVAREEPPEFDPLHPPAGGIGISINLFSLRK